MKSWCLSKNKRMKKNKSKKIDRHKGNKRVSLFEIISGGYHMYIYTNTRTICQWKKGRVKSEEISWYYNMVLPQVLQWRCTARRFPELNVSTLRRKAKYRQWDSLDYFGLPGASATYWGMSYWDPGLAILSYQQSGKKCVIVASAIRAKQGPCEPIKGCIRKIREQ